MGKATRWFKALLGIKRADSRPATQPPDPPPKEKRRWSFVKSYRDKSSSSSNPTSLRATDATLSSSAARLRPPGYCAEDASKHAIVVAAATAAAAEAAVAAAQAAAAVVRLTTSGRSHTAPPAVVSPGGARETLAAIVIQSHFRGYLARRALRALKGLVKLQALVRGHIVRKKTAETMRCIQAMLRVQARARAVRAYDSPSSSGKSSHIHNPGPPTPEKFEPTSNSKNTKGNQSSMLKGSGSRSISRVLIHPEKGYINSTWSGPQLDESTWVTRGRHSHHKTAPCSSEDDYHIRPDKILEIDTGKPRQLAPKRRKNLFESKGLDFALDQLTHSLTTTASKEDSTTQQTTVPSPASCEVQSALNLNPLKLPTQDDDDDDGAFCTAENSPRFYPAMSRGGSRRRNPLTPTQSDASATSCFSGYSDCPSYMAYTESSRAKMRSLSAPKQRPQQYYERSSSTKRWSVHQRVASTSSSSSAAMHASFASKAYPGSGHLDRLGMPVRNNTLVYYSGYLN